MYNGNTNIRALKRRIESNHLIYRLANGLAKSLLDLYYTFTNNKRQHFSKKVEPFRLGSTLLYELKLSTQFP